MRRWNATVLGLDLLLALACGAAAMETGSRQETIMTMPVAITVWADNPAACERALQLGFDEFKRVEQVFSAYRQGSAVNEMNQFAGRRPVQVSDEVLRVLQWARSISERTDGAFDITVAGFAWEYGFGQGDHRVPTQSRLNEIQKLVNYRHVMVYPDDKAVLFKRDGVQLDLGGLAKSYALNTVREVLKRAKVRAALVNAGGDVVVVNGKPEGGPWSVGIRHPRDAKRLLAAIPLSRGKVLSSGDYERFFEKDGTRYHHIFDSQTGKPVDYSIAATLLLPEKPKIDLPSVTLMLLTPEKAVTLVETIPGAECLIVDKDNKVWLSKGWKDTVKIER